MSVHVIWTCAASYPSGEAHYFSIHIKASIRAYVTDAKP